MGQFLNFFDLRRDCIEMILSQALRSVQSEWLITVTVFTIRGFHCIIIGSKRIFCIEEA